MRLCVSITESRAEAAVEAGVRAVELGADLVEIRFDQLDHLPQDLTAFSKIRAPKIATLRTAAQGGKFAGKEADRLAFFQMASKVGFEYIDIEHDSVLLGKLDREEARRIASYHDFEGTPPAAVILDLLVKAGSRADLPKAAFKINGMGDILNRVDASRMYRSTGNDFILVGMGEKGVLTRVCSDQIGSAFTYCSLGTGKESAPGQLDIRSMAPLKQKRTVAGVVGASLSHSLSSFMHNAAFAELGMAGRYLKLETKKEELEDLLQVAIELELRGFNVTIPYKEDIISFLDRLDDSAVRVGAVNTVLLDEGTFTGFNTDVYGVEMTFRSADISPKGKRCLVVGAGGAAKAVCAYLLSAGGRIAITNRTPEKARTLASGIKGARAIGTDMAAQEEFEIIVNCTPLGMKGYPDELAIDPAVFRAGQFFMDTIYNPPRTRLQAEAEKRGAKIRNGETMLVHQAIRAFEIWTGKRPLESTMLSALKGAITS